MLSKEARDARNQVILRCYYTGVKIKDLAEMFDMPYGSVGNIIYKAGPKRPRPVPQRELEIIELRTAGFSLQEIGVEYALTRERVRQILAKHGIVGHLKRKKISHPMGLKTRILSWINASGSHYCPKCHQVKDAIDFPPNFRQGNGCKRCEADRQLVFRTTNTYREYRDRTRDVSQMVAMMRYYKLQRAGICTRCGTNRAARGMASCNDCLREHREYMDRKELRVKEDSRQ